MESISVLMDYARQYKDWYWVVVSAFTLIVLLFPRNNKSVNSVVPLLLSIVVILFITFRPPVTKYFGDTGAYVQAFYNAQYGFNPDGKDLGHELIMQIFKNFDVEVLFFFYAVIYVGAQYLVSKKVFPTNTAVAMVLIVGSFSFFSYGFNGMRNGAACALVMLAFIERRVVIQFVLFLIAVSFHKSALLPVVAYYIANIFTDTRLYLKVWVICIIINVLIPNILGELSWLTDVIEDDRTSYLTTSFDNFKYDVYFSHTGFRWDFLLFSAIPIYFGWKSTLSSYTNIQPGTLFFNIYLICNSVWLFTARLPFNNRIAYLSWFLMPIVLLHSFVSMPRYNTNRYINLLIIINLSFCFIV